MDQCRASLLHKQHKQTGDCAARCARGWKLWTTVGFALPVGCVMLEMRLVSGTATRDFEPPSKLLQHFGYSSSPFYTTLPRRRLAAASGGEGDGKGGGGEGGGAGASLQAAAASARVGGGGVRWLQRGAGAAPRHPLDLASDEARLEFLQASTRGRPLLLLHRHGPAAARHRRHSTHRHLLRALRHLTPLMS